MSRLKLLVQTIPGSIHSYQEVIHKRFPKVEERCLDYIKDKGRGGQKFAIFCRRPFWMTPYQNEAVIAFEALVEVLKIERDATTILSY